MFRRDEHACTVELLQGDENPRAELTYTIGITTLPFAFCLRFLFYLTTEAVRCYEVDALHFFGPLPTAASSELFCRCCDATPRSAKRDHLTL
jgi:hypothetical protein